MFLKTVVYIDGYNLYYGLLRRSQHKWLDLYALFQDHVLDASADVLEIRYYTAPVLQRMSDDPLSSQRQRQYLQALRKMHPNKVKIIEGRMVKKTPYLRLVKSLPVAPDVSLVQVMDFTEKKTDVNLAADMMEGAWTGAFEQAVLCTNDTDLEAAVASIKRCHPHLRVGLVAPVKDNKRPISKDLSVLVDWVKKLSSLHVAAAQLPDKIPHTSIHKPNEW